MLCALLIALFWAGFGASAYADKRVALVIGNSNYQLVPKLPNPDNDAQDVAAALRKLNFDVIFKDDVDQRGLMMALEDFERTTQGADVALFYFAGHGLQFEGQNYLLPVDANISDKISLRYNTLSVDRVRDALEGATGVKILILDACRNNPISDKLVARTAGLSRSVSFTRGLARIDRAEGMVVAYATQADQVAEDGSDRNSPFSSALVRRLGEPNLEIATLFRRVAQDVYEATGGKQRPELSISLLQDFYLNIKDDDLRTWRRLGPDATEDQLKDFVAQFPGSPHVRDAQNRLYLLQSTRQEISEMQKRIADLEAQQKAIAQRNQQRLADEKARQDKEKADQERLAAERRQQQAAEEAQRVAEQKAAEQRQQEQIESERQAAAKRAAEQAEAVRKAAAALEQQRAAEEKMQEERAAEAKRAADEKEKQRLAAEAKAAAEKLEQEKIRVAALEVEKQRQADEAAKKQHEAEVCKRDSDEFNRLAAGKQLDSLRQLKSTTECLNLVATINQAVARILKAQEKACNDENRALSKISSANLMGLKSFSASATCDSAKKSADARIAQAEAENAKMEAACKVEGERFDTLNKKQEPQGQALKDLQSFQATVTCDRLRPSVADAVKAATPVFNTTDQIKTAQIELGRIGCYSGSIDGAFSRTTKAGVESYYQAKGIAHGEMRIGDALVRDLKSEAVTVCKGEPAIVEVPKPVVPKAAEKHGHRKPPAVARLREEVRPERSPRRKMHADHAGIATSEHRAHASPPPGPAASSVPRGHSGSPEIMGTGF